MLKLALGMAGGGSLLAAAGAAALSGGWQSAPPPMDPISMTHGFYVQEQWQCATAPNLFRFEGDRMGWVFADGGDNFSAPAEVELEPDGRYRIYIQNIDTNPAVHPDARFEFRLRTGDTTAGETLQPGQELVEGVAGAQA